MAHKVALINMKGGVGKSTLDVNLAWEMATYPWFKNVLVVDLDPQFNCSQYLVGVRGIEKIISEEHPTVWDVLEQHTSVPGRPGISLNPSSAVVPVYHARTGGSIDLIPSRLELSNSLRNPNGKEHLLKEVVDQLERRYDLVVIDCAPTESVLTTSAYLIADYILIPVRPEFLSTIGLPLLEQSLNEFAARHPNKSLEILGLVFNAISGYSPEELTSRSTVQQVAHKNGWPVFDEQVIYSRSFPKSAREGAPIFWTSYARTATKANFHDFAHEFANRIGI